MLRSLSTALFLSCVVLGTHYPANAQQSPAQAQTQSKGSEVTFSSTPLQIDNLSPDLWSRGVSADTTQINIDFDRQTESNPVLPNDPNALLPSFSAPAPKKPVLVVGEGDSSTPPQNTKPNRVTLPVKLEPGRVYVVPLNLEINGNIDSKNISYLVFQTSGEVLPENAPPIVTGVEIRTLPETPQTKQTQTSPTLVRISFNKDMNPKTQGFIVTQDDHILSIPSSQISYDKKTHTWQMTFAPQPGLITIQLNNEANIGFRSAEPKSIPLWPIQLSFQTPFQGALHQSGQEEDDSDSND